MMFIIHLLQQVFEPQLTLVLVETTTPIQASSRQAFEGLQFPTALIQSILHALILVAQIIHLFYPLGRLHLPCVHEPLFIQSLRTYLHGPISAPPGWLMGLKDGMVSRVLGAMHRAERRPGVPGSDPRSSRVSVPAVWAKAFNQRYPEREKEKR